MTTRLPKSRENLVAGQFTLSDEQRLAWLRLIRTENVGPATFRDLINHCGSAENALQMLPELVGRTGKRRYLHTPSVDEANAELEQIKRHNAQVIGFGEPDYPAILRHSDSPPPLVTIKGNSKVFQKPTVAIVGSRNASMAGITMSKRLAKDLGGKGYSVTSGLARGVDKAAHEASLATGTVAVLAGGLGRPYPDENIPLLREIEETGAGASISEMPFGWEPRARDFPRRNRIIAGLSLGVIIVEAAKRSGSLISARIAGEIGRQVFAVPGSPLDPRALGTNELIRNGATLITSAEDVVADLNQTVSLAPETAPDLFQEDDTIVAQPPEQSDRERIIGLLGPSPVHVDDLVAHSGLSVGAVTLIVMEAALVGQIERHSGNRVSIAPLGSG
ncbi:MAG: DNA-processing protein DprA [Pseudomonadota bacterium]